MILKQTDSMKKNKLNMEQFFRMDFILQDTSSTTTRTWLTKMIEAVLLDSSKRLTIEQIIVSIEKLYTIEFSFDEVKDAVLHSKSIEYSEGLCSLSPKRKNALQTAVSINDQIEKFTKLAISDLQLDISEEQLKDLLTRYLYYCFNTNIDMIMSLIDGQQRKEEVQQFTDSNKEIEILNRFLVEWNNPEKDKFIYQVVSYCYVYCSLNTKKSNITNLVFKNKKFFLDANVIFRLAGVNNDDRQRTIVSFVNKCRDAGIKLCYTDKTLDEVYRVIGNKVDWIKSIYEGGEPLSNDDIHNHEDDFYNLYDEWCGQAGHKYDDYVSFQRYLTGLINDVIDKLTIVPYNDHQIKSDKNFIDDCESLRKYKDNKRSVPQSQLSIETDVENYYFLVNQREGSQQSSIFDTNYYFISTDQLLMNWASKMKQGVPVVVLPSVWLTILLRYNGRTNDDYKAFCLFMGLRTHREKDNFDIFQIVKGIKQYTDNTIIKKKIVEEIIEHKDQYRYGSRKDIDRTIHDAFDVVLQNSNVEVAKQFQKQLTIQKGEFAKKQESENVEARQLQIEKDANLLAQEETQKVIGRAKVAMVIIYVVAGIILGAFLVFIVSWYVDFQPLADMFQNFLPASLQTKEAFADFIQVTWIFIAAIAAIVILLPQYLASEKREADLKKKYRERYIKKFSENK